MRSRPLKRIRSDNTVKIVVCIKQVPDTNEVKLDPVTGTLIRDGVPSIINPDDKAGLEAALEIKEATGAEVTVITMGPPQADAVLREAMALGADNAYLITDRAFGGADTLATSTTLAAAIKTMIIKSLNCAKIFWNVVVFLPSSNSFEPYSAKRFFASASVNPLTVVSRFCSTSSVVCV